MRYFADIFSSKTRVCILRALFHQRSSIPLRHIASLINVPVYSVQCALKQLVNEKIIKRKKKSHYALFALNPSHVAYEFLFQVFDTENKSKINLQSRRFSKAAKAVLDFCRSAQKLFQAVEKV